MERKMKGLETKRRMAGLTIAQLAKKSGVSAPTIVKIEAGRIGSVRVDTLMKLAEVFGCSFAELV